MPLYQEEKLQIPPSATLDAILMQSKRPPLGQTGSASFDKKFVPARLHSDIN